MKHSVKLSLAVFAAVFATLTFGPYKRETTAATKSPTCHSKICKLQKNKAKNTNAPVFRGFLPLDNVLGAN